MTTDLKNMKTFGQMWKDLSKYLSVERGLDEGYADGKYTKEFAKFCKNVEGIDLSKDFYKVAKENLKDCKNVNLRILDARKTDYPDKYFGVVFNTSFHEFDLIDSSVFKLDLNLKTEMLKEMARLSDTIVFAEIDPDLNISGDLYQVFNPIEDHCLRVKKSNELIDEILPALGYKQVLLDRAVDIIKYNSEEEFIEDMLIWWSDVKIPANEEEKKEMTDKIRKILSDNGYLQDLTFYDVFRYTVYKKDADLTFKIAEASDAEMYAKIINKSWKDTYGDYISHEFIDKEYNIEEMINNFSSNINNKDNELYMMKLGEETIGIVKLGKPDEEDVYKENMRGFGEILSLHILKDYCHQGYGSIAIRFAEDRLLKLGYTHSFVWVKKQNHSAIKFYTKHGYDSTKYSCDDPLDKAPSFVMEKYDIKGE